MHAAQLDGAGAVRRFFSISIPLLSPTTFFLLITTTLNSLQAFDLLRIMTPTGRGTNTMIFESYLQAFGGYSRAGYSARSEERRVGKECKSGRSWEKCKEEGRRHVQ